MASNKQDSGTGASSPFDRTAQHDAKRVAILSQAAKLFNSKGSRATTLKDIAESLGLTKTSLYYYVKTKEDLIYQCYMAALDHHHAVLDTIDEQTQDPVEQVSQFIRHYFDAWLAPIEGRNVHRAALLEIASLKQDHRERIEASYIEMFKRLRGYIRSGSTSGQFREVDAISATRALIGSMEWVFYWLHLVPEAQMHSVADEALSIIFNGLCPAGDTFEPAELSFERVESAAAQGFNRAERNRMKQEAFFKTGTRFFNRAGFDGASLDDIAEHLNVSKGAFYYHIKNKEDLLYSCYSYSLDITEAIYEEAGNSDSDGLRKTERACRGIFHVQNSAQGPLIRYNTITSIPRQRRQALLERTDASNRRFGDFLRQGITDGSVRAVNTDIAQFLIAGAVNAAMDISLWRRVDDIDAAAIDYFDLFFNGLTPRTPL